MRAVRVLLGLAACAGLLVAAAPASSRRVDVGHRLSIAVPPGWHVSHRRLTPCTNPIERFSVARGDRLLVLEERLDPSRAELRGRPSRFRVQGAPSPLECCAVDGRRGWVLQFGDGGRAFYAYLYPGRGGAEPLLRLLDTLRVGG